MPGMLTCIHHVQWIREVPGGLHQCIQCFQVLARKDVYPRFEDLPEWVRRRWDEHEASGASAAGPKDAPTS